jgi:hypothetical protein
MIELPVNRVGSVAAQATVRSAKRADRHLARSVIRDAAEELGVRPCQLARMTFSESHEVAETAMDSIALAAAVAGAPDIDIDKLMELIFAILEILLLFFA